MTVTNEQELEIRRLLSAGKSERFIVNAVNTSRRQVQNIKRTMPEVEDQNSFADDLRPTISQAAAVGAILELSTRPEGVRRSEMWPIFRARFGMVENNKTGAMELNMTDDQRRYLMKQTKTAAKSQGKEALFIPEWLPRHAPLEANDTLVRFAGYLHERAQEYGAEFTSLFPDTSVRLVVNELVCLAFIQATPEPVEVRCKRNFEAAEALQHRLGNHITTHVVNEPFPVDAELDQLCI